MRWASSRAAEYCPNVLKKHSFMWLSLSVLTLSWLSSTPLGLPAVPEVKTTWQHSFARCASTRARTVVSETSDPVLMNASHWDGHKYLWKLRIAHQSATHQRSGHHKDAETICGEYRQCREQRRRQFFIRGVAGESIISLKQRQVEIFLVTTKHFGGTWG